MDHVWQPLAKRQETSLTMKPINVRTSLVRFQDVLNAKTVESLAVTNVKLILSLTDRTDALLIRIAESMTA